MIRLLAFPALALIASLVQAQSSDLLEIRITQGVEGALPIAIVPFDWQAAGSPPENVSADVADVLRRCR